MKMQKYCIVFLFTGTLSMMLFGCGTVDNNKSENLEIFTETGTYNIGSSVSIKLLINNNSGDPVYYICSGDIYMEEIDDGTVTNEWKVNGFEECLAIRIIEPGDTKEFIFSHDSKISVFNLPEAAYSQDVQYRFRLDFYYNKDLENRLTEEEKYSNVFFILK